MRQEARLILSTLKMTMDNDTIAAISTPLGEGGIGIVRLSGGGSIQTAEKIFSSPKGKKLSDSGSHRMLYGFIKDPLTGNTIDEVLVSVMKAPNTYTREDVVEINCHGGILPLRKTLELVLREGARLAEPGEFTKRAFLNGRIDLSQAEAVIDIIRSKTDESRRLALEQLSGGLSEEITSLRNRVTSVCAHIEAYIDFSEEDIDPVPLEDISFKIKELQGELARLSAGFEEGRFFREGLKVAIVGRPNVGKSSLLNALLKRDRAIVTEDAGTTRDVLEEYLNIKGLPVRVMDTAGIREAHEMAEKEGVKRSLRALDEADAVIAVIDGSVFPDDEDILVLEKIKGKTSIITINKSDLPLADKGIEALLEPYSENLIRISATSGSGLDSLKDKLVEISIGNKPSGEGGSVITNVRHKIAIDSAMNALERASEALNTHSPLEIVALEMRDGLDRLGEIVGAVSTEDILDRIFSEFCIGK